MNISKRIYSIFLVSVGLWCVAIVAAPVLSTTGGESAHAIATMLYRGFSRICHQLDNRSLHILGAKFGVCVRCSAIYASFLAGILVWPFLRSMNAGDLPRISWLAVGLAPMILDAVLNDLRILASTELTRVVSGTIAGFTLSVFILPLLMEAVTLLFARHNLQGETRYAGKTE